MLQNKTILIVEDNDISRDLMVGVLESAGHKVVQATDGKEAITKLSAYTIDIAYVDLNMAPVSGFEFVSYMVANGINIPTVIITASQSSDILSRAGELGVTRVMQKPIDPSLLLSVTEHIIKRQNTSPPLVSETHSSKLSHEQLMGRAIEIASQNVMNGKGRAYGAVVANPDGEVLGQGTNGITSRVDPTAHAEIMAIRHAAEKLGQSDLSNCILYCTSEPTMMGQALIISVGIKTVYYGLTHDEIRDVRAAEDKVRTELAGQNKDATQYKQLCHDETFEMFKSFHQ